MTHPFPQSARGVTLIEVLIAILIISIGLLGMAGLQAAALKANLGASQRSAATMLASDMADRMRANMAGVNAGNYDISPINAPTQWTSCLQVAGCTLQQMAQNDLWEWNQAIQNTLPSGMGIVCKDRSPDDGFGNASLGQTSTGAWCDGLGNVYVIKIWWLEDRSESNPTGILKRVVISFQP
jgi:type IV pilus assembly protein PilV